MNEGVNELRTERMKDMKNTMMTLAVGILMVCLLPLNANAQQAHEWHSTSTMQMSGSNYSAQVGAIGATTVSDMATTTSSRPSRIRGRQKDETQDDRNPTEATESSDQSPIGDALMPLLLMAMLFCGVVYYRRKKALNS